MKKQDRIIQLISKINQVMKGHIYGEFAKRGIKATPTQSAVLYLLEKKDGRKITDFAQELEVENSAMTGVIDRMERAGLITRESDAADRRIKSIFITSQGRKVSARAKSIVREMDNKIEADISSQDIEICKRVLNHLYKEIKHLGKS